MKLKSWLCAFLLLLTAPAAALAQSSGGPMSAPLKIVVLGDNLLYGFQLKQDDDFAHQLEKFARYYRYNATVVNMCRISQTMYDGHYRLDEVLAAKPHIVILELGYNDMLQGQAMGEINKNLHEILYYLQKARISVLLVKADAPANVRASQKRLYDYMYSKMIQAYKVRYYMPLLQGVAGNPELTLSDKIHPNAKGVSTIVYNMFPALEPIMVYHLKLMKYYKDQQ